MTNQLIKGYYCDTLTDSQGRVLCDSSWRSNLIVQNCNLFLAGLMKQHQGIQGILYLAIGEGEDDWDSSRPSPLLTTSRLAREVARKALTEDHIVYLDNTNEPMETSSNRLEVTAEFSGEEFASNGPKHLREFGLFGGDATNETDSGFMIDYVIHLRIDLMPEMRLIRKVRLTFLTGAAKLEELTGFGSALPVKSIDGIGDEYARQLAASGVQSVSDLIEIDPMSSVGKVPQVKLREFRAKARMVMRLRVGMAPFMPLADRSISNLLREQPEDLADSIETPGVTPEMVTNLQEELAALQIALDDAQLQRITLGELINT